MGSIGSHQGLMRAKRLVSSHAEHWTELEECWPQAHISKRARCADRLVLIDQARASLPSAFAARAMRELDELRLRIRSARSVLGRLDRCVSSTAASTDLVPHVTVTLADSGAVLLEWLLPTRRLTIALEADPQQSGWHYAQATPPCVDSGPLETVNLSELTRRMLDKR